MTFQGIVLAGGKSSRFGEDKALARVGGSTLIERTVKLLDSLSLEPVVITNRSRDYSFLKCRIERDLIPDKGPIGGLFTACRLFKHSPLMVLTCDMPALTSAAVEYLMKHHTRDHWVTVYSRDETYRQPFPGIYEPILGDRIVESLARDRLSMQGFLCGLSEINLLTPRSGKEIFLNINQKKDIDGTAAC